MVTVFRVPLQRALPLLYSKYLTLNSESPTESRYSKHLGVIDCGSLSVLKQAIEIGNRQAFVYYFRAPQIFRASLPKKNEKKISAHHGSLSLTCSGHFTCSTGRPQQLTVDSIFTYRSRSLGPVRWTADGSGYLALEPSAGKKGSLDIVRYDALSGDGQLSTG